ncbi:MAG: response regulator [Magnetococcus sp. WYHC-3]
MIPSPGSTPDGTQPKLLVVDDRSANLQALRALLGRLPVEILVADSGNDALGLLLEHEVALMLLDVDMPGMDGFEVATMARSVERTRDVPIIFITAAFHDLHHRVLGYRAGAVDYIDKPIDDEILLSKVGFFLDLYRTNRQLKESNQRLREEVAKRQEAEEHLRLTRFIVDHMGDAGFLINPQGRFQDVNQSACRSLGYDRDSLLALGVTDIDPVFPRELWDEAWALLGVQRHMVFESRHRRRDGQEIPVEIQANRVSYSGQEYIYAFARDISARVATEKHLRLLSQAVESSPLSIVITDREGAIQYVNPKFSEITGYGPEEVVGRNPRLLQSGQTPRETYLGMWAQLTQAMEWRGEFLNRRKDGTLYWESVRISPVRTGGDEVTHYVAVKEDITTHKAFLSQLEQARRQADEANRTKSDFLATMSHEIRTPMNAILGMAEILEGTELSDEQRQYLTVSRTSGENLLQIINDILDISKVEAGRMELSETTFHLPRMLRESAEVIRFRAQEKGLMLIVHVDDSVPVWCRGDAARLRQILINFLGNAAKFTDQGCIALLASARPRDDGRQDVVLRVLDTGIGIPETELQRIFDPFLQVESTHTRRHGGTGLGLAICKRLSHLMEGTLAVRSQPGQGSVFSLTLPLGGSEAPDATAKLQEKLQGRRVLVYHDHCMLNRFLEDMLQSSGLEVISCDNSRSLESCLVASAPPPPHALILHRHDDDAPDILARVKHLRSQPEGAHLPILLCGRCRDRELPELLRELAVSYLPEPLSQEGLVAELLRLFDPVSPAVPPSLVQGVRIPRLLLVEDSPENQLLIKTFLKSIPHVLSTASNGVEAVARYTEASEPIDLVLMDVQMPEMDGYEATRRIRAWEQASGRSPAPILALTAYAMAGDAEKSLEAGCDGHLTKPIRKRHLLDTLQRFLKSDALPGEGGDPFTQGSQHASQS